MPREVSPMSASPNGVGRNLCVTLDAAAPGEMKSGGAGIQIADHGCHAFVVVHDGILTSRASRAHPVLAAIFETIAELPDARNEYRNQPSRMIRSSSRCRARSAAPSSW